MYSNDPRTVITLDAGGTNFVFGAIRANQFVAEPVTLPSNAHDLDLCMQTIVEGFSSGVKLHKLAGPSVLGELYRAWILKGYS